MSSSVEQIQEFLISLEENISAYISSPNIVPNVQLLAERLLEDLKRFGPPSIPNFSSGSFPSIPGLGSFEVPPPPPSPLLPSATWYDGLGSAAWRHKSTIAAGTLTLGVGLLVGYKIIKGNREAREWRVATQTRKEVVVILGGDTPYGPPLIQAMEKQGYIVIVSVATADSVDKTERKSKGYVKALVLDPSDPSSTVYFLRSLKSALSLRFPLHRAGDPYLAPSSTHSNPLTSVISLLSLAKSPEPEPVERLSLSSTYIPYLYESHLIPLAVIQSLLPLLRISLSKVGRKECSIIVLVPATASRVGVPFGSLQAMATASMTKSMDVLRRELKAVGDQNIKVIVVDTGACAPSTWAESQVPSAAQLMKDWSATEKATYGRAFEAALGAVKPLEVKNPDGVKHRRRRPEDVTVMVNAVVSVVMRSRLESPWARLRTWSRGDRFSVGAGAKTYSLVSYLPPFLLDTLLILPTSINSIRTRLTSNQSLPAAPASTSPVAPQKLIEAEGQGRDDVDGTELSGGTMSSVPSDFDLESSQVEGTSRMGDSWVSLKDSTI